MLAVLVTVGLMAYAGINWLNNALAAPRIPPPPSSHGHYRQASKTDPRSSKKPVTRATQSVLPASFLIKVPAQSQLPELENGCEVTSLSMLLTAVGHPVSKMVLAQEQPTDPTPPVLKQIPGFKGNPLMEVTYWGNPNVGFVGSVSGKNALGYGIYNGPLAKLLNSVLPGRALDLTGKPFQDILAHVASGTPVEVWTTINFLPTQQWVTWQSPEGPVTVTPLEHAVLLVGYNATQVFVNNPYTGEAAEPVNRSDFVAAWKQLGRQALTVSPGSSSNARIHQAQ